MLRQSVTGLCGIVAATAALFATSAGATATEDLPTRAVLRDAPADVLGLTGHGELGTYEPAGDRPTADVLRASVAHRRGVVVVRMQFADLRRVDAQVYTAWIATPGQHLYAAAVGAKPGSWRGSHEMLDGRTGEPICSELRHSIDYATNQVTIRVPRPCIGRPAWVRVSMQNFLLPEGGEYVELTDNPHNETEQVRYTRRLYRG